VCPWEKGERGKGGKVFKNMADEMKKEKLRKKITFIKIISASAWRSILLAADMLYQLLSFFTSC
jgi:hypothetical protein